MRIENFYTLFKQKWKTKTSIQKSQREAFGEYLLTFLHDLSFLHELPSEFIDDMV